VYPVGLGTVDAPRDWHITTLALILLVVAGAQQQMGGHDDDGRRWRTIATRISFFWSTYKRNTKTKDKAKITKRYPTKTPMMSAGEEKVMAIRD